MGVEPTRPAALLPLRSGSNRLRGPAKSRLSPGTVPLSVPGDCPPSRVSPPQNWNRICACIDRIACAPVAAPNPAFCGWRRVCTRLPDASYCGLLCVRLIGTRHLQRGVSTVVDNGVERVERFQPKLERPAAAQSEIASQREVDRLVKAAVHVVLARLEAEARIGRRGHGHREGRRVELRVLVVRAAGARIAVNQDARRIGRGTGEVLVAVAHRAARIAEADGVGRARAGRQDAGQLPVVDDRRDRRCVRRCQPTCPGDPTPYCL